MVELGTDATVGVITDVFDELSLAVAMGKPCTDTLSIGDDSTTGGAPGTAAVRRAAPVI